MSLYSSDTRYNTDNPIYAPLPITVSSLTVSSLTANKITANSTITGFIEGTYGEISNWYVDNTLYVNFQALTADSDQLFLNGIPVATTANLSSIQDWSIYAQISTLDGNNQSTIGLSLLESSTIKTPSLIASNIFTQNLMAFNIVNFTSTVIEVYESTIQSDIKLANISTANISNLYVSSGNFSTLNSINGAFNNISAGTTFINTLTGGTASFSNFTASSITVSSIVSPPASSASFSTITVVSNTNTGSLTVGSNNVTTFAAAPTFSDGGNFNGARPNFNTGFNTTGTSFFNNQTICNVANISNSNTTLNLIVDASTNTGTYPTINLQSKFGGGGIVNITADSPSIFVVVPTQQVNIRAKGGVGYVSGIPVGGAINLQADAGTSNQLTPTGVLANGAIRLTAQSFINGAFTVPGLILESAGSIAAYSGLTAPSVGVFGCSFYSALTTLSLTCGVSPVTTSFPGVVYLRGDNGTKVVNGFYTDSVNNNVLYDLDITSKTPLDISNRNINIDSACNVNINTSNGGQLVINGTPYSGGGVVSTFTTLQTSSFTVSSINGASYPPAGGGGWVSTATTRLDMNGNPITDTLGTLLLTVGSTNYTSFNQTSTSIDLLQAGGAGYVRRNVAGNIIDTAVGNIQTQATSTINTVPHTVFTGGIRVSSINGSAYPPASVSSWVSTATTPLFMSDNYIAIRNDGSTGLAWGSVAPYSVGVDGPYLFGYSQGALGTTISTNDISLAWDASVVEIYKTLNLNNQNITGVSSIQGVSGNLRIAGQVLTSNTSNWTNGSVNTLYGSEVLSSKYIQWAYDNVPGTGVFDNCNICLSSQTINLVASSDINTTAQSTINTVGSTWFSGDVSRFLISSTIPQPIIQYGQVSSSGASGSIVVTIPQRYTSVNSYLPFACMGDAPAAEIYVSTLTRATFEIGWQNGGGGNQVFNWNTMGT